MEVTDKLQNRLTRNISLVLISSSLILNGCSQPQTEEEKEKERAEAQRHGSSYHSSRSHWFPIFHSSSSGSMGRTSTGSSSPSHSVSSRGGFGSSGHAHSGGHGHSGG